MKKIILKKEQVRELYWIKTLSCKNIGEIFGCSGTTIHKFMKLEGIPRRRKTDKMVNLWTTKKHKDRMSQGKKGSKNHFYGKVHSAAVKKQLSDMKKDWHKKNPEYIKGENHHFFGKKLTETHKKKISNNSRNVSGENNPMWGVTGSMHPNWKPPYERKTLFSMQIRTCKQYSEWRTAVYKRDNFTCTICNMKKPGKLNADHITPLAFLIQENSLFTLEAAKKCNELWDLKNGRTLCIDCHKETPTYGIRAQQYKKQ